MMDGPMIDWTFPVISEIMEKFVCIVITNSTLRVYCSNFFSQFYTVHVRFDRQALLFL